MSEHQAPLSLSRWVLIQGCTHLCRHPARSAQATPRWTCARKGRGRAPRGGRLLREPRASSPREAWEGAGGTDAAPTLWLVLGASPPLCWRCGPSLGDVEWGWRPSFPGGSGVEAQSLHPGDAPTDGQLHRPRHVRGHAGGWEGKALCPRHREPGGPGPGSLLCFGGSF